MASVAATVVLLLAVSLCNAQDGVLIGSLPTRFHEVSGDFVAISEREFCIRNFNYDGLGPDAFLYFYYTNDAIDDTGGGVIIPISEERPYFERNRRFTNEEFCFNLPVNYTGCDFGGFGIWCRYANQLFTDITWNFDDVYSLTDAAGRITCNPSPGRGYVGVLPTLEHQVGGSLFIKDNKTFVIRNFTYDGLGPDAFVYPYVVGEEVDPLGGGVTIPLTGNIAGEEGRFADNIAYDGTTDFVITIPDDMDSFTCDYGAFTIWCREFTVFFTNIEISGELFTNNILEIEYQPNRILCNRTATRPGFYLGELPTDNERDISGSFYFQDQFTFFIQLFSYTARRENTFLYVFERGVALSENGEGGIIVPFSDERDDFPMGIPSSFYNQDFTVDLRLIDNSDRDEPISACDLGYFAIIDTTSNEEERLTEIMLPEDVVCGSASFAASLIVVSAIALLSLFFQA